MRSAEHIHKDSKSAGFNHEATGFNTTDAVVWFQCTFPAPDAGREIAQKAAQARWANWANKKAVDEPVPLGPFVHPPPDSGF